MNILPLIAPTLALSGAIQSAPVPENRSAIIETIENRRSFTKSTSAWQPVTLLRTEFVGSSQERRLLRCEDCGSMFYQYTTVLWLRDVFSDGTARTYSQTLDTCDHP